VSDWSERVALVTGGTRGIGFAVAKSLAEVGALVGVTGRDAGRAEAAAQSLSETTQGRVVGLGMDVSVPDAIDSGIADFVKAQGRIDILVNNAGITRDNLLMRMKADDWDEVMRVNAGGIYHCSRAVLRPMIRQRYGRIINMSSVVGLMGNAGQTNYAASKAAMLGFTKALAREVASREITVNAVAPGYIETDMTEAIAEDAKQALYAAIPLGRIGAPEEVANVVRFLASPESSYITGQVLQVNGGLYM